MKIFSEPNYQVLKNMRSVIHLVPGAVIPNRPMFRYSQGELAEMQTQVADLVKRRFNTKVIIPFWSTGTLCQEKDRRNAYVCRL
jgi:hypothetical protein